jgi:tRNA1Val (adenine37-N6)-methyltransferase
MPTPYFQFKQFTIHHDRCAMKVTTDSCFFGAWAAQDIKEANQDSYREKIKNLLDIGTGTGLLSLMVAQRNELQIDAVEIDPDASQQAKENVQETPWKDRITIFNKDILSFDPQKKYDCIICNPPFYEKELASGLVKKDTAHHSQYLTIAQVLNFIKKYLTGDGSFYLMYPFKRKEEVEEMLIKNELHVIDQVLLHQSVKHVPFRVIIKGGRKKMVARQSISISICDENGQYTSAFIKLLKDYYLYL